MRAPAKILVSIFAVAFFLTVASSARADSFDWNFSSTAVTASGTFTTGAFSGGQATITGITGTVNGTAIASLLPTGSIGLNDNILFYPGTPYLDGNGVSFSLTGGDDVNIYYVSGFYVMYDATLSIDGSGPSFTVTPVAAPEPGTMLLLAIGLLGLAALQWRRKARSASITLSALSRHSSSVASRGRGQGRPEGFCRVVHRRPLRPPAACRSCWVG